MSTHVGGIVKVVKGGRSEKKGGESKMESLVKSRHVYGYGYGYVYVYVYV